MTQVVSQLGYWLLGLMAAFLALATAFVFSPRLRSLLLGLKWWLVGLLALVLVVVFLGVLPRKYPPLEMPLTALPGLFRRGYWAWLLLFTLLAAGAGLSLFSLLRTPRQRTLLANPEGESAGPSSNELSAAWESIGLKLHQAGIEPSETQAILILSPDEESVDGLLQASGLQVFASGPDHPGPVRVHAVQDGGLIVSAGGLSCFATGRADSLAGFEELCRLLLSLNTDCPIVRAVIVLFPVSWAAQPDSTKQAALLRDDLAAVRRGLQVRTPVYALFTGMETVPGFLQFMSRLSTQVAPRMLEQRVGFAVPEGHAFSGDLVQRGLVWMSGWFHNWVLTLLSGDMQNATGNADLVTLDHEIRRYRNRLKAIMEAAFATPRDADPVLFRGLYFAATGRDRTEQAFAAGLLRGARSRIPADHVATRWTDEARSTDRRYIRTGLLVAGIGGLLCMLTWFSILRLSPILGWAGLIFLAAVWVYILFRELRS